MTKIVLKIFIDIFMMMRIAAVVMNGRVEGIILGESSTNSSTVVACSKFGRRIFVVGDVVVRGFFIGEGNVVLILIIILVDDG